MVKFIHTSDLHIGQSLYHYEREEEYNYFFEQLGELVEKQKPNALLVCGDVFHTSSPSSATSKLYTRGILGLHEKCPTMKIIVTAGNHDSYSQLESMHDLWQYANVTVIGYPEYGEEGLLYEKHIVEIIDEKGDLIAYVIAIPFVRSNHYEIFSLLQKEVARRNEKKLPIIMMSHLTVEGADLTGHDSLTIGGIDSIMSDEMGDYYDYLALGHIHCPQFIKGTQKRARYSGSPLQTNFDENYPHSVSVVTIDRHGAFPEVEVVEIKKKMEFITIPIQAKDFEDALKDLMNLDKRREGYLRLNVISKNFLPENAQFRIDEIMKDKKAKFCYVMVSSPEVELKEKTTLSVEELKKIDPIEIAQKHYESRTGEAMSESLMALFREAMDSVMGRESSL